MSRLLTGLMLALVLRAAGQPELLWKAPPPLTADTWACGPGGCDLAPAPPFHFLHEDHGGTTPKFSVRDRNGRTWSAKFGAEVIPESFGARFAYALGYFTEPTWFVAKGKIDDVSKLGRAQRVVERDGTFQRARFQLRDEKIFEFLKGRSWGWNDNPFRGTRELAGLKIVMMLLSNWDAKDSRDGDESNTNVFRTPEGLLYVVYDWGASLGRWGSVLRRDQSDCSAYWHDSPHFVRGVRNGRVEFGFSGKHGDDLKNEIGVEDVRWLLPYLLRITPEQLRAGLQASGASPRQTACWAQGIEERIRQLQTAAR